jgi:beta-lactamase class A
MVRRSSPGIGQWFVVTFMVMAVVFLLFKLYQYGSVRRYLPTGLTVAGVEVGGYMLEEAGQILTDRYISAPVTIYYGDESIQLNPSQAEFVLDREAMLSAADYQRVQQDFWSGFWGFLWGRPYEVEMVELRATHNRDALREVLRIVARQMDREAQPAQPVPPTLSFQAGAAGLAANLDASLRDVESALYRPFRREAHLVLDMRPPPRPDINMLNRLLTNHLAAFNGVASVFIMDLHTGEEIGINADQPMSGMSVLKVPIILETLRLLDMPLTVEQQSLISETIATEPGDTSANLLLDLIAGQDNAFLGADILTESMARLGLANTYLAAPYGDQPRPGRGTPETAANSRSDRLTEPDPVMQTTAEDIGALLSMLYYCAEGDGGALRALYRESISQEKCRFLVEMLKQNYIGSLLEEGVPPATVLAHKHGWVADTHADAGIVFSPGGDYVVVVFMHKRDWLEWEISSPLIADVSRATYNYFNFEEPYLSSARSN